jgi:hypothetical protein
MTDPIRQLKTYGRDVGAIPVSHVPQSFNKVAFLCINTYKSYRLNLGTGPINDAVSLAKCVKRFEFEIYFMHNPHARNFLKYLDVFFKATTGQLVVYYVGHGTSLSESGNQAEEAFLFDDGRIPEDELIKHLLSNKNESCSITFITDACHTGTIWNIQDGSVRGQTLPPNILSLSAYNDSTLSKTASEDGTGVGIFTSSLTKFLKEDIDLSPNGLEPKMSEALRAHGQSFVIGTTTPDLLTQPLFS